MAIITDKKILTQEEIHDVLHGRSSQAQWGFFNSVGGTFSTNTLKDFIAATIPEILDGARIPMTKVTNNPNLNPPKASDQRYFGQLPIFKVAMDQLLAKKIGVYPSPTNGAGGSFFNIVSNPNITSNMTLDKLVSTVLTGGINALAANSNLLAPMTTVINSVTGIVGGSTTQLLKTTDKDIMIPLMSALSSAVSGGTKVAPTFSNDVFSEGYKMAQAVIKFIG